jgi:hypothetical protein
MNFTKTYFLPPTLDFIPPPPYGPLTLGSILTSTALPHRPLNADAVVPAPLNSPPITETNWRKTVSETTGCGLGIYAQFLQIVGLNNELSVDHRMSAESILAFDSLATLSFEPGPEYIAAAIQTPAVQSYLRNTKTWLGRSKAVYLVTGLKIVRGAQISYSTSISTELSANLGVDGTAAAVPATIGLKGHWTKEKADKTSLDRADEFVFAFRVKKVTSKSGQIKDENFNEGAFLSIGAGDDENPAEAVEAEEIKGTELHDAILVQDSIDGEQVYCVPQH